MKKILIKYNHKQLRRVTLKQILPDSADFQQIKSFRQKKKTWQKRQDEPRPTALSKT